MNIKEIGRNDPCPCGSGKKYKRCCLNLKDIVDVPKENTFDFYSQLIAAIKYKLDSHYGNTIKKQRKDLLNRFIRFTVDKNLPKENESIYSDWLWFDKVDSNGVTTAQYYMNENEQFLDKPLLNCLKSLNNSYLSIYIVVEGEESTKLLVKDIFTNQEYPLVLKEELHLDVLNHNILLLGRILNIDNYYLFSGMVLMLYDDSGQQEFIDKHLKYLLELHKQDDVNTLLKQNAHIIYGIYDHAKRKTLINLNDIRIGTLTNEERNKLINNLESSSEMELVHKTPDYIWFKPLRDTHGYVRLTVGLDNIIACADVLDDVAYLLDFIQEVTPDKQLTVISSLFVSKKPQPEYSHLWFEVIKDQETEAWLNTVHKELDNKTPIQLLKEENGINILNEMLMSIKEESVVEEQIELIDYMLKRISTYNKATISYN